MPFAYSQRLTPAQQRLSRAGAAGTTFLWTLLHELCHHLDYELLRFPDSLHTEGFTKRKSSLFGRLMGEELPAPDPGRAAPPGASPEGAAGGVSPGRGVGGVTVVRGGGGDG